MTTTQQRRLTPKFVLNKCRSQQCCNSSRATWIATDNLHFTVVWAPLEPLALPCNIAPCIFRVLVVYAPGWLAVSWDVIAWTGQWRKLKIYLVSLLSSPEYAMKNRKRLMFFFKWKYDLHTSDVALRLLHRNTSHGNQFTACMPTALCTAGFAFLTGNRSRVHRSPRPRSMWIMYVLCLQFGGPTATQCRLVFAVL